MLPSLLEHAGKFFKKISEDHASSKFRINNGGPVLDTDATLIVKSDPGPVPGKIRRGSLQLRVPIVKEGAMTGEFTKVELSFTAPGNLVDYTTLVADAVNAVGAFLYVNDTDPLTLSQPMRDVIAGEH